MTCPGCGCENRDAAKFCSVCGQTLVAPVTCPTCGTTHAPGQRFCDECGQALLAPADTPAPRTYTPKHLAEKILTARAALEGERKQVTVLFADVKGSMDLAERVDPEEWHRILDRFFAILAEGVHRFEGTVNQYTGDGIMALFGAPIAHEDHAQRACWAALHLQEALRTYAEEIKRARGLAFAVRMGLNSGDVVVGKIGDDLRMDYTAQGYTVGLAQRMEQLADPGRVYLTEHTAALVAGYFRLRDLGVFDVKGVREPVRVHELEGTGTLRTRLDLSRARGFSRFVGRADEMAALEAALARALEGDGHVVGVVADAGVGKSRLCFEFLERCRARGIVTYRASGVAYGKSVPLLPVLELQRDYYGITAADSAAIAREKIAGRLLLLDRAFDEVLPVVFDFLGVGDPEHPAPAMEPEARQRLLFELIRRVVQLRGRREPTVTLLEDLHWFDGGSNAFLVPLVEARSGTRALLVVNFRPEYRADWMQKSYYQQLPLRPLGGEATDELLRELLGADPSLAGVAARIRERTAGNPFFIEEVVRALEEAGDLAGARGAYRLARPVETFTVPATVQAVLAARIDRLAEREKGVLQTAAVIGQEFGEDLLGRVSGLPEPERAAALRTLVTAEFLYASALFPEAEYTFTHPLTREVAYGSQLGERRAHLHAAVATALEARDPDRLDERAALLAHHWESAGDALRAARWHRRAATWLRRSAFAEARRHLERVRALVAELPDAPERAELGVMASVQLLEVGTRLGLPEDEARALFEQGRTVAAGDPRALAALHAVYGRFRAVNLGDMQGLLDLGREAVRLADQAGDRELRLAAHVALIMPLQMLGRTQEALDLVEATLGEGARGATMIFGFSPTVFALASRGFLRAPRGRPLDGLADLERALAEAEGREPADLVAIIHGGFIAVAGVLGDETMAMAHAQRVMALAASSPSQIVEQSARWYLGEVHLMREEWGDAVAAIEQGLAFEREVPVAAWRLPLNLAMLAEAHGGAGNTERARTLATQAIDMAQERGLRMQEIRAQLALARVLLRADPAGARAAIEAALARAEALIEETGLLSNAPFVHLERARLAHAVGDEASRQRELREAERLFTEMGAPIRAAQAAKELGALGSPSGPC
jgi:class 3 adenylate cyclase/tetratricopeptide (TPR) repeat protein